VGCAVVGLYVGEGGGGGARRRGGRQLRPPQPEMHALEVRLAWPRMLEWLGPLAASAPLQGASAASGICIRCCHFGPRSGLPMPPVSFPGIEQFTIERQALFPVGMRVCRPPAFSTKSPLR
jgi:hypothetical protein